MSSQYTGNGYLPTNGVLTKVKSLDSICKEVDEAAVDCKFRQRARRRRRVRRSASTSRCLSAANNKPTLSPNAPANGQTRCCGNDLSGMSLEYQCSAGGEN